MRHVRKDALSAFKYKIPCPFEFIRGKKALLFKILSIPFILSKNRPLSDLGVKKRFQAVLCGPVSP